MNENEYVLTPRANSDNGSKEFHATHDTPVGTLLDVFVEEVDPNTDNPRVYVLKLSVGHKPITHAPRLDVISSEPPLPGYEPGDTYKVSLDTAKIKVKGMIGLKASQVPETNNMRFVVHDILAH